MWEQSARREIALARWGVACAILLTLAGAAARAEPAAKDSSPGSGKSPDSVRLPGHTRSDTGRVADPRTLHGDSKIEGANATQTAGERVVRPIPSTSTNPGEITEPPPFRYVPAAPTAPPSPPASAVWQAPAMPWTGTFAPAVVDAGMSPDVRSEPPAAPSAPQSDDRSDNTRPSSAGPPALDEKTQPSAESSPIALAAVEPNRPASKRNNRSTKLKSEKQEPAAEKEKPSPPADPMVPDMFDLIRAEIKNRLPYFQACADGSRRRAGPEIHRLQATWFINADGTIKELRLDEVPDAQLAACLTRAGSRPFPVHPGMELTIPTPIVFVR